MAIQLNHTIVWVRDSDKSARFLADLLGVPPPTRFGPFLMVQTANGVSLDFMNTDGEIAPQHYAFLVGDDEFDLIFGRIQARGLPYWADPHHTKPSDINHWDGGRGVYFEDPDGHSLEILTRPYGSGR